jgi:hypothetical protein
LKARAERELIEMQRGTVTDLLRNCCPNVEPLLGAMWFKAKS